MSTDPQVCGMGWCARTLYSLNQESLHNVCLFSSTDVWLKYAFAWQVPVSDKFSFSLFDTTLNGEKKANN